MPRISDIISKRPEEVSDDEYSAMVKEFDRTTKKLKVLKKAIRRHTGITPRSCPILGDVECLFYDNCRRENKDTPDCRQGGCRAWGG